MVVAVYVSTRFGFFRCCFCADSRHRHVFLLLREAVSARLVSTEANKGFSETHVSPGPCSWQPE
jgi:hypothetical protein